METIVKALAEILRGIVVWLGPANPKWASHMAMLLLAFIVLAFLIFLIARALISL